MTVILKGSTQLERLLPLISKAIVGCERHSEVGLGIVLQRWRDEAISILYPKAIQPNVAERANIAPSTSHVQTINSPTQELSEDDYPEEPIDQELYDMTVAVMAKYPDLEGPEIAKQAAHNIEYKIPIDKI